MAKLALNATGVLALAGVVVGGFVLWKAASVGKGLLTGDNALTRNATDSDGKPVTAYQNVPVLGTLGAATNAASGGYLATFGSWLGRTAYDLTHPEAAGDQADAPKASYDETARLAARYPATSSPDSIFAGSTWSDQAGLGGTPFEYLVPATPGN